MPVSPGVPITSGSSGTKDKDGCEDDIAEEEEKHCLGDSINNNVYLSQMEGNKRATTET